MSVSPPAMPSGLLVQSVYVTDEGEESGWRVWEDGRHESRRDGSPWGVVATLDAEQLAAVREALDSGGLDEMAGIHGAGDGPRQSATLWFQAVSRGQPQTVALIGGARLDALDSLTAKLIAALAGPDFPFA
jgi:hypothetical protein